MRRQPPSPQSQSRDQPPLECPSRKPCCVSSPYQAPEPSDHATLLHLLIKNLGRLTWKDMRPSRSRFRLGLRGTRLLQAIFNFKVHHCCFSTRSEAVISAILIPVLMLLPAIISPDTKETSEQSSDTSKLMKQSLLRNTQPLSPIVLPERSQPVQGIADSL
jgi:hypothetical protein